MSPVGKKVLIFGAGFSGLTLAWELAKRGASVEIHEKQKYPGGLIQTTHKETMVESAAHAFLASAEIEQLFQELKIQVTLAGHRSKKKWIFRTKPRNWSLSVGETVALILKFLRATLFKQKSPRPLESVAQWASRVGTASFNDYALAPALQGIYGSQSDQLSASLVVGGMFEAQIKPPKGEHSGSIAPLNGMSELIHKLTAKLKELGVVFHFDSHFNLENLPSGFDAVVIATPIRQTSGLLKGSAPALSEALAKIPAVSLVSATIGFQKISRLIQGFGCLFPLREKFNSLGVLFNTDLFANRGPLESETWIFGEPSLGKSDAQIKQMIFQDRERLSGKEDSMEFCQVFRWPEVLPLYGTDLERLLQSELFVAAPKLLKVSTLNLFLAGAQVAEIPPNQPPVFLTGNYLGGIGLSKILSYNKRLAARICPEKEV